MLKRQGLLLSYVEKTVNGNVSGDSLVSHLSFKLWEGVIASTNKQQRIFRKLLTGPPAYNGRGGGSDGVALFPHGRSSERFTQSYWGANFSRWRARQLTSEAWESVKRGERKAACVLSFSWPLCKPNISASAYQEYQHRRLCIPGISTSPPLHTRNIKIAASTYQEHQHLRRPRGTWQGDPLLRGT